MRVTYFFLVKFDKTVIKILILFFKSILLAFSLPNIQRRITQSRYNFRLIKMRPFNQSDTQQSHGIQLVSTLPNPSDPIGYI